jgi:hypothetical protein
MTLDHVARREGTMAHAIDREELIAFLLAEYREELDDLTDEELVGYLHALDAVRRLPAETWRRLATAEAGDPT